MRLAHRLSAVIRHPLIIFPYLERARDRLLIDRRYGFPTDEAGVVSLDALGHGAPQRNSYAPSSWGALRRVLPKTEVDDCDVFIDFGSGMGRVVIEAAQYRFRRVIRVEIAPQLTAVAERVVQRNRHRLRCTEIELITADANEVRDPGRRDRSLLLRPVHWRGVSDCARSAGHLRGPISAAAANRVPGAPRG